MGNHCVKECECKPCKESKKDIRVAYLTSLGKLIHDTHRSLSEIGCFEASLDMLEEMQLMNKANLKMIDAYNKVRG